MTLTKESRTERPRLRGQLEIVPLSVVQYERMIELGILGEDDPIELLNGYMVGLDRGLGQARPEPSVMPKDPPRLAGLLELWPLSVEQFERMIAAGILGEDDPIELLQGYMVALDRGGGPGMPPGPKHALTTDRVTKQLTKKLPEPWVVRGQNPIRLGQISIPGASSEPEPAVAVVRGPDTRFAEHLPGPEDIRLLVEVSDSSLSSDREFKGEWYAKAGIPLYWIVNLIDRQLEVYSDPDPGTGKYRSRVILGEDQQVVLQWEGLEPITFSVKDFLP
jgi:Uma2 family endonuclease